MPSDKLAGHDTEEKRAAPESDPVWEETPKVGYNTETLVSMLQCIYYAALHKNASPKRPRWRMADMLSSGVCAASWTGYGRRANDRC